MFVDITDPDTGNVIGYYDTVDNFAIPLANVTQDEVDTAAGILLATPAFSNMVSDAGDTSGFGFDRPATINWAGLLPPADPIAAGLNPANIVKTTAGALWKYVQTRSPTGVVSYTAQPYTAPATVLGMSPLMLAAVAAIAILAIRG